MFFLNFNDILLNINIFLLLESSIFLIHSIKNVSSSCSFSSLELNQKDIKPLTGALTNLEEFLRKVTPSIQKRKTNQIRKAKRCCKMYTINFLVPFFFVKNCSFFI